MDETGVCTNQKGRAQTTTSTDRGAEPSFLGRPGPAQTKWQSPLSQADRDQRRPSGRASSQNGTSHPLGPFRGNAGGMGAFGGISGHKPVGTKADQDQQDQDQHRDRGLSAPRSVLVLFCLVCLVCLPSWERLLCPSVCAGPWSACLPGKDCSAPRSDVRTP